MTIDSPATHEHHRIQDTTGNGMLREEAHALPANESFGAAHFSPQLSEVPGTVYYRVEPIYDGNDPIPEYLRIAVATEIGTLLVKIDNRK